MVDQFADGSDGSDADRAKADKKWNFPWDTQGGKHQDGSTGIDGSMESMAKDQADQEGQKKMNPAMEFKKASIKLFNDKADIKYDKGQAEQGDPVYRKHQEPVECAGQPWPKPSKKGRRSFLIGQRYQNKAENDDT